jgi:hypothetical protein
MNLRELRAKSRRLVSDLAGKVKQLDHDVHAAVALKQNDNVARTGWNG